MKVLRETLEHFVGESLPDTSTIEKLFTFHAFEVEGVEKVGEHEVIDVKVLPDRSSDCYSHRGIAHELGALLGTKLVNDPLREEVVLEPKTKKLTVTIENGHNCRRFSSALLTGVHIGPSPDWLKTRLIALGQRSINNVVDATNYVMLMLGQPLHAYDADKFPHDEAGWHFGVRMAREGEEVTTLSNETFVCTKNVQLITEAKGDIPVGIAGVKGGKYAEIDAQTKNIILEAANFDPIITRRSSQSLKLQTDASKRFENDLPPALTVYGLKECVRLILLIAHGTCGGYLDEYPTPKQNTLVEVSHAQLTSLLGIMIPKEDVEAILTRLSFAYEVKDYGWVVTAPFERTDVTIPEDVIADIGRVFGYAHVASVIPESVPLLEYNAHHYYSERIRDVLASEGFSEIITSSFRNKDEIELANALASDKGCLRSSLTRNINEVLDRNIPNLDLLRLRQLKVFEIGTVFSLQNRNVTEYTRVALGVRTKQNGPVTKDAEIAQFAFTKILEVLGVENVTSHTAERGVIDFNFTELISRLPKPNSYTPFRGASDVTFKPYSLYPFISRDIALWCEDGVTANDIDTLIKTEAGALFLHSTLFDEFHKDGKVSYAFRLVFQSFERTLTDSEVGGVMEKITEVLQKNNFVIR